MAQKVNIVLIDDIDGSDGEETVTFGIDGSEYEIDLSRANAQKLRDAVAPYVAHARRSSKATGRRRSTGSAAGGPSPSDMREWARANGMQVNDRGRVSAEVREAYNAAH